MYREFSNDMRKQGRANIFGANEEAIMTEFQQWLENKKNTEKKI